MDLPTDNDREQLLQLVEGFRAERPKRIQSILQLKSLNPDRTICTLTELLHSPESDIRCISAEVLFRLNAPNATALILSLLHDPVASVRWYVCGLLHDFGGADASSHLATVLLTDPDGDVRLLAAAALQKIGDQTVIPALRKAHQHDDGTDSERRRIRDVVADAITCILAREAANQANE
jgi:HEAT repeat protein